MIMNKILKYSFGLLLISSIMFACTKAEFDISITDEQMSAGVNDFNLNSDEINCWYPMEQGCNFTFNTNDTYPEGNSTLKYHGDDTSFYGACYKSVHASFYISKSCLIRHINVKNVDYTSQQCQSEYNLIPISEVTANYCRLNFDLIDPAECPINSGTGAIVWSNLNINDTPYAQNQNINVYIPDFLAWTISFNDYTTAIEVEGYNADTDYIENVINQEKLTPTNEDFAGMLTGLVNLAPYLFITLLMFFFIRLINKIWK